METPYDEVLEVKHGTTRKEKQSTIMAMLHAIPKKIADVSQTQGVSEKFLENGLPSGVINPSMLSHDRFLSVMDAIQDAIIISILILLIPLFPLNGLTGTIFTIILLYWFFHIGWWEKTKIWSIKSAVKKYLASTYRFYWAVLYLLLFPIAYGMWYFVFQLSGEVVAFSYLNVALDVFAGAERAMADVFGNVELIKNNLSPQASYEIIISSSEYESAFIIVSAIFFTTTAGAKILFTIMYKKERLENEEFSSSEMQYRGENALDVIKKHRNA